MSEPVLVNRNKQTAGSGRTGNAKTGGDSFFKPAAKSPTGFIRRKKYHETPEQTDLRTIQRLLRTNGLYHGDATGKLDDQTARGLDTAYAGPDWKPKTHAEIISDLQSARPSTGAADSPNYRAMFADGILDINLGIGFEEGHWDKKEIDAIHPVLRARGFTDDKKVVADVYKRIGRAVPADGFETFVKPNAILYQPPVGDARWIPAVIRFIANFSGSQGGDAAHKFEQGMIDSDVTFYGGHARYGSGPDFDRNMTFDLLDNKGKVTGHIDQYEDLETTLKAEGKPFHRSAWEQFLWRDKKGLIRVNGFNAGNIYLNPKDLNSNEFGARMMYWNLNRGGGAGGVVQSGKGGALDTAARASSQHYRIVALVACRTKDYTKAITDTPGLQGAGNDFILSKRTLWWNNYADNFSTYLDGIMAEQDIPTILTNMEKQNTTNFEHPVGHTFTHK
jgi:hypothetical protein